MTKLDEKFGKEFETLEVDTPYGLFLSKKIKDFYNTQVQKLVDEMVGEEFDLTEPVNEVSYYEMCGQDEKRDKIIKIAERWGYNAK